ncbi:HNH endonuclease [Mycobacterium phage Constella]|nr:HNH endonuclease [Mycobacterium phage Constella]
MDFAEERWRDVVGYEGLYEVSTLGRVRSVARTVLASNGSVMPVPERIRTQILDNDGRYYRLKLHAGGHGRMHRVHRLVLEAFVGPPPEGMVACHNNGDALDNRVENLRWDTQAENNRDIVRHGRHGMASKTHCPQGHEYTAENTCLTTRNFRRCRQCMRDRKRTRVNAP